jgi:hypothetical protein
MDQSHPSSTEFFADPPTLWGLAGDCAFTGAGLLLFYFGIRHSGYLWQHGYIAALALCWVFFAGLVINFPRQMRERIESYRGRPILRLDEHGIWVRNRESFNWIDWADVQGIKVETGANRRQMWLTIRDERKYLNRASWIDWTLLMANRALSRIVCTIASSGVDPDARAICVADSSSLNSQWGRLVARD